MTSVKSSESIDQNEVPASPENSLNESNYESKLDQQQQQPQQHPYSIPGPFYQQPLVTPALRNALFNGKDRGFVIQLEQDLLSFIQSNTDSYLLKPMNSYYRLLTHQTAQYYSLGHSLNNEGNSILVFKTIGVELAKPPPLASIPFAPIESIPFQSPQQFIPQPPVGFQNLVINTHHGNFGFQPHQPRQPQYQQFQQFQPQYQYQYEVNSQGSTPQSTPSSSHSKTSPEIKTPTPAEEGKLTPKEFKLMKRETSDSTSTAKTKDESDNSQTDIEQDLNNLNVNDTTKDPVELQSERESRQSLYLKAKERIFQDEEEDDDEEDDDNEGNQNAVERRQPYEKHQYNYPTPSPYHLPPYGIPPQQYVQGIPVPLPHQQPPLSQQHSPVLSHIPGLNIPPQQYYQYPRQFHGGFPQSQQMNYNDQPQYRKYGYQNNYNSNGNHRKNRGGYNGNRNHQKYHHNSNNNYNTNYNHTNGSQGGNQGKNHSSQEEKVVQDDKKQEPTSDSKQIEKVVQEIEKS